MAWQRGQILLSLTQVPCGHVGRVIFEAMMKQGLRTCMMAMLIVLVGLPIGQSMAQNWRYQPSVVPDSALVPGVMAIKVDGKVFPSGLHLSEVMAATQGPLAAWRSAFIRLGIHRADSVFSSAYKLAIADENGAALNRMQQAGLAQWFMLNSADVKAPSQLWTSLQGLPGLVDASPAGKLTAHGRPNDGLFGNQWYLENTGQSGGKAGADIKAVPAWDITSGQRDLRISVHDGGILTSHPDLADNIWSDKGYNFVTESNILVSDAHGTHVAGLAGAVRNNTAGISGVAQATLMSLQIIGGTPVNAGYEANSFVYAANNGATISQNSWSYTVANFMPGYTADAINYFLINGGGSYLKGGIVVFSAGNFAGESAYFPGAFPPVVNVAATNHQDLLASYSTYGRWIDLCAPGGDALNPMVSTVNNGAYGNLFGTSMAAPLVSGSAALLATRLQGRALPDDIVTLLRYGVDDIYPLHNSFFAGKLGTGRLNLHKAMLRADTIARWPQVQPVQQLRADTLCDSLRLRWAAPPAGYEVMIAYAPAGTSIGLPFYQVYQLGQALPEGGTIVYRGSGSSATLPMAIDGTGMHYRLWVTSVDGSHQSIGTDWWHTVPFTASKIQATASVNTISLGWQRLCPQRGILILHNQSAQFGIPSGDPAAISTLPGGGSSLAWGNGTTATHTGLQPDESYYYAFYAYQQTPAGYIYSQPTILAASTLCATSTLPIAENFGVGGFPPANWRITDGGPQGGALPDGRTWQITSLASSNPADSRCVLLNAYTQNGNNSKEKLRSPAFNLPSDADSIRISFDYAYRAYNGDAGLADSLEVGISTDCGVSNLSLWKAGGVSLATVAGFSTAEFVPLPGQWASRTLSVARSRVGNGPFSIVFTGTNKFGQNLWLDQVRVQAARVGGADVALLALAGPDTDSLRCTPGFAPAVRVRNLGPDTLRQLQIISVLNNDPADTLRLQGLLMAPGTDSIFGLKVQILPVGLHQYSARVAMPNLVPDVKPNNDTLRMRLLRPSSASLPHSYGAETAVAGAWENWPQRDGWLRSTAAAWQGTHGLVAPAHTGGTLRRHSLLSPLFAAPPQQVDSILGTWMMAAAGNSANPADTLRLWLLTDCGLRKQLVGTWWGAALYTAPATGTPFLPSANQWRQLQADLTPLKTQLTEGWQLAWELNRQAGNQLWIDDLRLNTVTLPAWLKQQGYGVYPNPFGNSFTIWHLEPQPGWQSARLMSATGQVLRQWQWKGNAPQTLRVQAANMPSGIYYLQLQYAGSQRTVKLVKH